MTFDLDVTAPLLAHSRGGRSRLTALSEGLFGIRRAVPRLLEVLGSREIIATFYVPGSVVAQFPSTLEAICEAGHAFGHHGHDHLRSQELSAREQRAEIESGLAAWETVSMPRPFGYRSPAWELTPNTARLLAEYEFQFDSSLMEDDRPYFVEIDGSRLVELPVHWSLDDWVFFGWNGEASSGSMADPNSFHMTWYSEFLSALEDRRPVTFTMHPEIIGRGYRARELTNLIDSIADHDGVRFTTHTQLADRAQRDPEPLGEIVSLEFPAPHE